MLILTFLTIVNAPSPRNDDDQQNNHVTAPAYSTSDHLKDLHAELKLLKSLDYKATESQKSRMTAIAEEIKSIDEKKLTEIANETKTTTDLATAHSPEGKPETSVRKQK